MRVVGGLSSWQRVGFLSVGLLVASIVSGVAVAYTPYVSPGAEVGDAPKLSVEMTHSKLGGKDPKPGEQLTYTAKFKLAELPTQDANAVTKFTVTASALAPFDSAVTAQDFRYADGSALQRPSQGPSCDAKTRVCTISYRGLKNSEIIFQKQATVDAKAGQGELIAATASVNFTSQTKTSLEYKNQEFTPDLADPTCSGIAEYEVKVNGAGGWLADIKFSDADPAGRVKYDRLPLVNGATNPTAKNSLQVTDANGRDITAEVLKNATHVAADPSKPFAGLDQVSQEHPDAKWIDSMNWPLDVSNYTGKTWLPAGATVKIKKRVQTYQCTVAGTPSVADYFKGPWQIGMTMQVVRPNPGASANGRDTFFTPGYREPASCATNVIVGSQPYYRSAFDNDISTTYYKWSPPGFKGNPSGGKWGEIQQEDYSTEAIAATDRHPTKIFSIGPARKDALGRSPFELGLYVFDSANTTTSKRLEVQNTIFASALAFDKHGWLWSVPGKGTGSQSSDATTQVWYLTAEDIDTLLKGETASWRPGAWLTATKGNEGNMKSDANDIAFDGDDRMYIARPGQLFRVNRADLLKDQRLDVGDPFANIGHSPNPNVYPNGMAFVGNKLYIGQGWEYSNKNTGTTGSNRLFEVTGLDQDAGQVTEVYDPSSLGYQVQGVGDMASCSFPPAKPAAAGGTVKIQKSVIDPVTGAVVPAGTTSPNPTTVAPDGTVVVDYLVTVSATGDKPISAHYMTDIVTVPTGFGITDILVDGVSQGTGPDVPLPKVTLDPTKAETSGKVYRVQVKAKINDYIKVDWNKASTCQTEGAGKATAGGFFNFISMPDDSDGEENNDACITIEKKGTAKLTLKKKIVDNNGREITIRKADAQYFELTALGPINLAGTSKSSGQIAVQGNVLPGTYRLVERGNDAGRVSGGYRFGTWSCDSGKTIQPGDLITISNGDDVICEVENTPVAKGKLVKTATEVADLAQIGGGKLNPHIGKQLTPAADGALSFKYTITLTNIDNHTGDLGAVADTFVVPAGLVWDGNQVATVSFDAGSTKAQASELASRVTKQQLEAGKILASKVTQLPAGASVKFNLVIPLRLDTTVASGQTQTNFERNAALLGTCSNLSSEKGNAHTDAKSGVRNWASLAQEDQNYNDIPNKDNLACVPVGGSGKFALSKWADEKTSKHLGANPVSFDAAGQATVEYWIKVNAIGTQAANAKQVIDLPTAPAGTQIVGNSVEVSYQLGGNTGTRDGKALTEGQSDKLAIKDGKVLLADELKLAAATAAEQGGQATILKVSYRIELTGKKEADRQLAQAQIGSCVANADGTVPDKTGGVVNSVSAAEADSDSDGQANNKACHSVNPRITVLKFGENCDVDKSTCALVGAEFRIYPDNGSGTAPAADPIADGMVMDSKEQFKFTSIGLQPGTKYWLVETKAPKGHELLATPIGFSLDATGIKLFAGAASNVLRDGEQILTLKVIDNTTGDLPQAGGKGPWITFGLAIASILSGLLWLAARRRLHPQH